MVTGARKFRSDKSLADERTARNWAKPFLERCGFANVTDSRSGPAHAQTQVISAAGSDGAAYNFLVRLCWARRGDEHQDYSAAQLAARLRDGDVEETLNHIDARSRKLGLTHHLVALYDVDYGDFVQALLIPSNDFTDVWRAQRDAAQRLIDSGGGGGRRKNPAMNGNSPTLWLEDLTDARRKAYTDIPWTWPGVINILDLPTRSAERPEQGDTLDDLGASPQDPGREAGTKVPQVKSGYRRNAAVRNQVRARAKGACERASCQMHRAYAGFLDVHHIFGIQNSDRVWTCVALCPNCHREAHYSPNAEALNAELRDYAAQFRPKTQAA